MEEQGYTVTSDSEATGEQRSSIIFPELAIGVDIGTYQSKIALWNGSKTEILKSRRSYVSFKGENPSSAPSNELDVLSGSAIFNMKRLIGRLDTDPVVHASKSVPFMVETLDIGGRPFIAALVNNAWRSTTPEEVLAVFLVELKAMVEMEMKSVVRNVVLTVPVSFSRFQLSRMERACAMAGLHVLRLMTEPSAVALLHAQQQQLNTHEDMGSGVERIALIFNMGAGYCDVGLTAAAGGVSQIKATSGSPIGGEDLLQNMMRYLVPNFESDPTGLGLLRIATQDAIEKLSSRLSTRIDVDIGNGRVISRTITREEFERVNTEIFGKCEKIIIRALHDAKMEVEDVDDVILVGGCSVIPRVKSLVLGLFKKEMYSGIHALEAAACGAALEGAVASGVSDPLGALDLLSIQAVPMSIGVRADGGRFVPVIYRNMAMPARKEVALTTTWDEQTAALIVVYEGEEERAEENHLLGFFKVVGIPLAARGVPVITVCVDIDAANILRVFAGVTIPGQQTPAVVPVEARMPMVDDGHGWCEEAISRAHRSGLDLVIMQKN